MCFTQLWKPNFLSIYQESMTYNKNKDYIVLFFFIKRAKYLEVVNILLS